MSFSWCAAFRVFILCCLLAYGACETNYCNKDLCPTDIRHVACNHTNTFAAQCPKESKLLTMDATAKAAVLRLHNLKRDLVASGRSEKFPKACNMATLVWDDELEQLARLNTMKCDMEHDLCHNTLKYRYSGQNLFLITFYGGDGSLNGKTTTLEIIGWAIEEWNSEQNYTTAAMVARYPENYDGPAIGHFLLMHSERNVAVGCAISSYYERNVDSYLMACDYATTNMITAATYVSCTEAGSKCKSGLNPEFNALCSTKEVYAVNKWV